MMRAFILSFLPGWPFRLLAAAVGAGAGFAYYWYVGCDGGCPITGNPWSSTAYGFVLGFLAYPGPRSAGRPDDTGPKEDA